MQVLTNEKLDFGNVLDRVDIAQDRSQIAVRVDDERRAPKTLPVGADAVRIADRAVGVRQQDRVQVVLLYKGFVAGQVVLADADQNRVEGVELRFRIPETDRFPGSPGGIVFRVEEQHDFAAAMAGEVESAPGAGGQLEFRGRTPCPHCIRHC